MNKNIHISRRHLATPAILRVLFAVLSLAVAATAQRGESDLDPSQPVGITPEQIIQKFAAKEKEFSQAREDYTYRQEVQMQTMDGDTPNGEYHQVVDVTFDAKNRRKENVVFSPQPDLKGVILTQEDFDDINHLSP